MAKTKRADLIAPGYAKARRAFIEAWDGPCWWCKRAPANEVDHVVPVDEGVDPTDQSNWVGACKSCNSKRGADYLNARRAETDKRRRKAVADNAREFFCAAEILPPIPSSVLSERSPAQGDIPESIAAVGDSSEPREIPPRLISGLPSSDTYGHEVAAIAEKHLGITLMPWQRLAVDGQLQHDDQGDLDYRRSLVSVARQNGKTVALRAMILWALTREPERRGEPVLVISTAHKLDLATEIFEGLAPIIVKEWGAKAKHSYGRSEIIMPGGSRWLVQAATPANFHGFSPHYIFADEIWNISREVLLNGAIPSQRVMRSPLLSCWSTAGTEESDAMTQMREEGIRAIDEGKQTKLFMAEWSCPPGVDYMARPDLWPMANPAIGYTLDPAVLADESEQIDKGAFLRASLNVWVTTVSSWLAPGVFDALEVPDIPAGGVLAIDSSIDEALYSGVRAVELEDGRIGVTVAFVADSLASCWEQVEHEAAGCVSVAMPPNMFDIAPVSLARKKVQVGYGEIQTHTSTVRSLINEGRLVHTGEEMLREHVGRAVGVETRNGYAIVSQRSPGPITMARCMVWAASIIAKPVTRKKPQIAFAGR